jgi:hypothetical protein
VVKYQKLEVIQSVASTAKSVPPATGRAQPGNARSRTTNIFTAKAPYRNEPKIE